MLGALTEAGIRWLFVSNIDNLGATVDERILGWIAERDLPFVMEVTERTESDRKGGHLMRTVRDERLGLREVAQCPPDELDAFQDISRHRFFNTNNLWLDLEALTRVLETHEGALPLPVIRNEKPVDPTDPGSARVVQLETAMGSAIALFEGADAVRVPRTRFVPVKTTSDLLVAGSDAYVLTDDWRLVPDPARTRPLPFVDLDKRHYALLADFEERFPRGFPSLAGCTRLVVEGDVEFGDDVRVEGDARVIHDGGGRGSVEHTVLRGTVRVGSAPGGGAT